ncbi:hypothetical protein IV494_01315 [Kaistella sp. G5-32]|uniref:Uncharacterized protein n=1 Tax=Kaistella gelatinilytica TaxID=2787636 RepID=A0ABS0F819_9FLAO|nr:hypothetical protein [Kaistella gelatinilytica]MBF8455806.1 hypothetical protein [Kaistella gelatinilytica]
MPPCHLVDDETDSKVETGKSSSILFKKIDPVVQLVRMPPCHLVDDETGSKVESVKSSSILFKN